MAEIDYQEILSIAEQFYDLGIKLYATTGTADTIKRHGIPVQSVSNITESGEIYSLMEKKKIHYLIYTGAVKDDTMGDFIAIHRRAMQLGIPCLTSLDTAGALLKIIASRYTLANTELVDINNLSR